MQGQIPPGWVFSCLAPTLKPKFSYAHLRSPRKRLRISRDGWPTQARFWLEWGSSTAGQSVPAARSRFRAVHSDSISTRRVAHTTRFSLCGEFKTFPVLHQLDSFSNPTQAKTGLEWATLHLSPPMNRRGFHLRRLQV